MCNIAIVTEKTFTPKNNQSAWFDDDGLAKALRQLGHTSAIVAWTDKSQDWQGYDAIYVSTTWDACDTPQAFLDWLEHSEADGRKRLINSRNVLEDGFLKYRYMSKLERHLQADRHKPKGMMIPSRFLLEAQQPDDGLEPLNHRSLADLLDDLNKDSLWKEADIILKPCISADGKDTFVYKRHARDLKIDQTAQTFVLDAASAEKTFQRLAGKQAQGGVIVQPYIRGVERGEYSLTFFEDHLSHAIRKPAGFKKAASKQRRVVEADHLPDHMLSFATYIVNVFRKHNGANNVTRLRVDLFDEEGMPVLCELEAVEPNTNIGVVARERGRAHAETIFRNYAGAIGKHASRLSAL